jgi:hypothetical protein
VTDGRLDPLDETARTLHALFTETVLEWERSFLDIRSIDGHPLPPVTDGRFDVPIDELGRAFGLALMSWATDAAVATDDAEAQIALVRESYEMALTVMNELDAAELDVIYGIRLLIGDAPWGRRIDERAVRQRYPDLDLGAILVALEDKRLIQRSEQRVGLACW